MKKSEIRQAYLTLVNAINEKKLPRLDTEEAIHEKAVYIRQAYNIAEWLDKNE